MSSFSAFWIFLSFPFLAWAQRGFVLTAPKILDAGTTEHLSLTLSDVPSNGELTIKLLKANNDQVLSSVTVQAKNDHTSWVQLPIPSVSNQDARLQVTGVFNSADDYQINSVKDVRLRNQGAVIFIQTDKLIYKPGQTVKFRILPVDVQLRALPNVTGHIWIEDPLGIRVAQWRNVTFYNGFYQMELQLSHEPNLGKWSVKALISNTSKIKEFEVRKYVLPRYEVHIIPPSFVLANAEEITWTICAKYIYGKEVEGLMKAHLTYKQFDWEKEDKNLPFVDISQLISGCQNITIATKELEMQNRIYSYRALKINVEVIENATGIRQNSSKSIEIEHNPLKILFTSVEHGPFYFKPGLPYYGMATVSLPSGEPAPNEDVEICAIFSGEEFSLKEDLCKTFLSNREGEIQFTLPGQDPRVVKISIEAKAVNHKEQLFEKWGVMLFQPQASIFLKPWYSPSGSYIQIEPNFAEYDCGKRLYITVKYTTNEGSRIKFYHQVLSRGRIISQGSHFRTFDGSEDQRFEMNEYYLSNNMAYTSQLLHHGSENNNVTIPLHVGQFQVILDSHPPLGPIVHLLVFYIGADGEVVADSRKITIKKCLENQVNFEYKYEQQYPGNVSPIILVADPFSYCGITAVDRSVHLLQTTFDVTKSKVFDVLKELDLNRNTFPKQVSEDYCKKQIRLANATENITQEDETQTEEPINEKNIKKKRAVENRWLEVMESYHVDSVMAFEETGVVVLSDFKMEVRPCVKARISDLPMHFQGKVRPPLSRRLQTPEGSGHDSPVELSQKSSLEIRDFFPETWLWEIVKVEASGNVILSRELPHTITEWIGNAFCISPTTGIGVSEISTVKTFQPFFIELILPYSVIRGEILPVTVTVFNYLQETLSVKITLEGTEKFKIINGTTSHKMCIPAFKSYTHKFYIKPQILGFINLTIYGYALQDDVCWSNGATTARLEAHDSLTKTLLVEPEGYAKEKVESIFFCPSDYDGGVFHHEFKLFLPKDVIIGSASARISVSGDIMGPTLHGLEKLVNLPVGCGEQNMVLFAPNIFILDYLTATSQGTESFKGKALSYLKTGYQRELTYRHSDGSYSAFGRRDKEGSMWLTAFVVKSFSQARKFISIDREDLEKSTAWILRNQLENGCFPKIGTVLNAQMKGGLRKNEGTFAPLTAYIMIALLESELINSTQIIENGFYCLMAETDPSNYELALFAYAAVLAKHPIAEDYLNQLDDKSKGNGQVIHWSDETIDSQSVKIEIASYVVLSLMAQNYSENLVKALPIVRWIVQQRNPNGGFVSTQDTVVALQALSIYATHAKQTAIDLSLFVEADELHYSFSVNNDNVLLMQSRAFPVLPTIADLQSVGDGCAFVQVMLKYNVQTLAENATFDLQVEAKRDSFDCSYLILAMCFRYIPTGRVSNMAVLELHMLSGYVPDEISLFQIQREDEFNLKRFEVTDNIVTFYYDEISNEENCFHFKMKEEIPIENIQPAVAKIYDYYEPESFASVTYFVGDPCGRTSFPEYFNNSQDESGNVSEIDASVGVLLQSDLLQRTVHGQMKLISSQANNATADHLKNFVDVDFELDFPEGLEGNQPVTEVPPVFQASDEGSTDCPACFTTFPPEFTTLFCQSDVALKVQMRNISQHRVKVIQDLSPSRLKAENVNVFAEYSLLDSCECTQLGTVNDYALILGSQTTLWKQDKVFLLNLRKDVVVIAVPMPHILHQQVKLAKKKCIGKRE